MAITSVEELIQAIGTANSNGQGVIELAANTVFTLTEVDNTTDGPNGLPSITGEVTINGNGSIIERDNTKDYTENEVVFRIFHVAGTGRLILNDLTVRNGKTVDVTDECDGGGILNKGALIICNCGIFDNTSQGNGGGIYNHGTLKIESSRLEHNGACEQGGAIYNDYRTGNRSALCAVNRCYDSGGIGRHGLILAADIGQSSVTWSKVMNGLPLVYGITPQFTPSIKCMYLDPFNPEAAYVFLHDDGIELEHGLVYYNQDWRNDGTWIPLMKWKDVVGAEVAYITDRAHCGICDALISFTQPGLCYILVKRPGSNEPPTLIRLTHNNGNNVQVQYSPCMTMNDKDEPKANHPTYISDDAQIALGHDDPDQIWVIARHDNIVGIWKSVWDNFTPIRPENGTDWWPTEQIAIDNVPHFILNPYFKLDGSINPDTQLFIASSSGEENVYIRKSELSGAVGTWVTWTTLNEVPLYGKRDRFDVPGKPGMCAWWRSGTNLRVLETPDPTQITSYTIPEFTDDGFTLHWPFNPGQYYAAQDANYNSDVPELSEPILKMTYDADSGKWIDLTGNMWSPSLLAYPATIGVQWVEVVGFYPHWAET